MEESSTRRKVTGRLSPFLQSSKSTISSSPSPGSASRSIFAKSNAASSPYSPPPTSSGSGTFAGTARPRSNSFSSRPTTPLVSSTFSSSSSNDTSVARPAFARVLSSDTRSPSLPVPGQLIRPTRTMASQRPPTSSSSRYASPATSSSSSSTAAAHHIHPPPPLSPTRFATPTGRPSSRAGTSTPTGRFYTSAAAATTATTGSSSSSPFASSGHSQPQSTRPPTPLARSGSIVARARPASIVGGIAGLGSAATGVGEIMPRTASAKAMTTPRTSAGSTSRSDLSTEYGDEEDELTSTFSAATTRSSIGNDRGREIREGKEREEQVEKEARIRRKVLDLEITNTSLLAINGSLELLKVRNRTEIRDLRRRLRESRMMPSLAALTKIPDEGALSSCIDDGSIDSNDDDDDDDAEGERVERKEMTWEQVLAEDPQFATIATTLHSLVTKAEAAINHRELQSDIGRVLHPSEIQGSREASTETEMEEASGNWSREGSSGIFDLERDSPEPDEEGGIAGVSKREDSTLGLGIFVAPPPHASSTTSRKEQPYFDGTDHASTAMMSAYPSPPMDTGAFSH